jgi:DNA-binding transcriptional LysR family regulator
VSNSRILAEGEAAEAEAFRSGRATARHGADRGADVVRDRSISPRLLPEFLELYPEVDLDLQSERIRWSIWSVAGSIMALRIAALADSSLRARRLCAMQHCRSSRPRILSR